MPRQVIQRGGKYYSRRLYTISSDLIELTVSELHRAKSLPRCQERGEGHLVYSQYSGKASFHHLTSTCEQEDISAPEYFCFVAHKRLPYAQVRPNEHLAAARLFCRSVNAGLALLMLIQQRLERAIHHGHPSSRRNTTDQRNNAVVPHSCLPQWHTPQCLHTRKQPTGVGRYNHIA